MADTKISALTSATLPLSGSELVPIVQSGTTVKTAISNIASNQPPTPYTANGVVYASSTSALATGSALVFDGTNLGLGVTPSAWAGAGKVIQFGNGSPSIGTQNSGDANFMHNAYESPAGTFKYVASGGAPRYQLNINSNTHAWYTAASGTAGNTISFTQAMTLNASGNLGIGTSSPAAATGFTSNRLVEQIIGPSGYAQLRLGPDSGTMLDHDNSGATITTLRNLYSTTSASALIQIQSGTITFGTGTSYTEAARIDSSGDLLVGKTATNLAAAGLQFIGGAGGSSITSDNTTTLALNRLTSDGQVLSFWRSTSQVGNVSVTTSATAYNTSSDYRLKNTIAPMTGALAKVALLKPVTYKWNVDGSDGEGFIAHELAEVCPQAVTGTKDAVDADGKPVHQGMDVSFLVATLTAAIQEQQALITQLTTRLTALENK